MTTRRSFLKQSALIGAAVMVGPGNLFSKPRSRVGIQLYTLRNQLVKDLRGTIGKVSAIGFKEIETYGYSQKNGFWGLSVAEFKKLMKNEGLKSPSGHYEFEPYLKNDDLDSLKYNIEAANGLGQKYLTVPFLSSPLRTNLDSYKSLAEKLNKAAILTKDAGLQLAYHNHDFEFQDMDGTNGFEILRNETSAKDLKFELDLYWTVRAGKDPLTLFAENPGRIVMWHVKDLDKTDKSFAPVGAGSIDFASIFAQYAKSGMKHYFVEQDVIKGDPFETIAQSFNYLKSSIV